MKNKYKKIVIGLLFGGIMLTQGSMSKAATTSKHDYYSCYSRVNLTVAYVDFKTDGNTKTHSIYNYYVNEEKVAFFNALEDVKMWVSTYPSYKRASYTATHKFGLPTPWDTVGYTYNKINLHNNF